MTTIIGMADRFRVTQSPAALLARLAQSPGLIVSYGGLHRALEEGLHRDPVEDVSLRKAVKRARDAIQDQGEISTVYGVGYRLTWAKRH